MTGRYTRIHLYVEVDGSPEEAYDALYSGKVIQPGIPWETADDGWMDSADGKEIGELEVQDICERVIEKHEELEPEDDDIYIRETHGTCVRAYYHSRVVCERNSFEELEIGLREYMANNNYYPNVWRVGERGDMSLYVFSARGEEESK